MRASQLLGALVKPAIAGAGMFAAVAAMRAVGPSSGPSGLVMLIVVGAISYALLSLSVNREGLRELRSVFGRRSPTAD
jgi:hypothetical protein